MRAFPKRVGPRILSLERVDNFGTSEHFSGREKKRIVTSKRLETIIPIVSRSVIYLSVLKHPFSAQLLRFGKRSRTNLCFLSSKEFIDNASQLWKFIPSEFMASDCIAKTKSFAGICCEYVCYRRFKVIYVNVNYYSADIFCVLMSTTPLSAWSFASLEWRFTPFYCLKKWIKGRSLVTPLFKGGLSDEVLNHSHRPAANVLSCFEHNPASTRR